MSRFQFVADNSATSRPGWTVKRLCELVEIEHSSYYAWSKAAPARPARARADAELAMRIRAVHAEDNTQGRRGSPLSSTTTRQPASGSTASASRG